jgi:hypothetical protein
MNSRIKLCLDARALLRAGPARGENRLAAKAGAKTATPRKPIARLRGEMHARNRDSDYRPARRAKADRPDRDTVWPTEDRGIVLDHEHGVMPTLTQGRVRLWTI